MTTALAAGAALMIRALSAAFVLLLVLILALVVGAHVAFGQEVIQAQPLPLPPTGEVPTVALWFYGVATAAIAILISLFLWRLSLIESWVRRRVEFHGLAAALIEDELIRRGVVKPNAAPAPDPIDDPWAAEADKVAPPPPAPPPRPKPHVVAPLTPREMAQKLTPRTKAKGNA